MRRLGSILGRLGSVLERLGMCNTITRSAVLQSAKSVEALMNAKEPEVARRRAKLVLRYVDMQAPFFISRCCGTSNSPQRGKCSL